MISGGVRGLRSSFALRTVAGGVVLVVGVVLLASVVVVASHRQQQVDQVADVAHRRAAIVGELIDQVSVPEAVATARDLAARRELGGQLAARGTTADINTLLAGTRSPAGVDVYVLDRSGKAIALRGAPAWPGSAVLAAVTPAVRGGEVTTPTTMTVGGQLTDVVAVPVRSGGATVGAVAALVPLPAQAQRFATAVGLPIVLLTPGHGRPVVVGRTAATRDVGALVDGLASAAAASGTELRTTTTQAGQTSIVDVVRLGGPAAGGQAAFAGVAVPLPGFLATEGATIATVALLALLAATLTSLAVLLVVDRWVRRPVAELERGVARIADGDYSGDIQVAADDELGRLGQSVNRMARQIAEAVDSTRAALSHLRFVSEALTALDLGAEELSASVARAAAAIAGEGAAAAVIRRRGDATVVVAHGSVPDLGAERAAALRGDRVLSGHRLVAGPWRTSFPLAIDEGVVTGRLVIDSAAEPGTTEMAALGTLANYAGMALDHARLLEQEHETVRRLRAANAARTEFLSTTHHELRTPLSIVLGMAELAESSWDRVGDDARRRYLAGIVAGARRLARTIESVLTMTVLATEEVHLSRRLMPLRPVVDRVVGAAEERWRLEGEREVHVDVDASLRVDADPELFESMLDALIDNAMKFTRSGGRIEVSAHIEDGALVMQVRDDGIGISAAALPHVFERFYQAERGHARQFGGLGLGLTIAQRVCAVHGADIAVQSLQPHGAVATVRWPLAGAVVQSAQDPAVPAI